MEKRTNFYDFIDKIQRQDRYIEELEEENKKLKDDLMEDMKEITKLEEENKKLKEERDFFYKSAKQFREQVEKWEKDFVEGRIVEKE